MFRKIVDGPVALIVYVHDEGIVVTAEQKETFDTFNRQLKKEFPANDMDG